jgi:hypothetical protein
MLYRRLRLGGLWFQPVWTNKFTRPHLNGKALGMVAYMPIPVIPVTAGSKK